MKLSNALITIFSSPNNQPQSRTQKYPQPQRRHHARLSSSSPSPYIQEKRNPDNLIKISPHANSKNTKLRRGHRGVLLPRDVNAVSTEDECQDVGSVIGGGGKERRAKRTVTKTETVTGACSASVGSSSASTSTSASTSSAVSSVTSENSNSTSSTISASTSSSSASASTSTSSPSSFSSNPTSTSTTLSGSETPNASATVVVGPSVSASGTTTTESQSETVTSTTTTAKSKTTEGKGGEHGGSSTPTTTTTTTTTETSGETQTTQAVSGAEGTSSSSTPKASETSTPTTTATTTTSTTQFNTPPIALDVTSTTTTTPSPTPSTTTTTTPTPTTTSTEKSFTSTSTVRLVGNSGDGGSSSETTVQASQTESVIGVSVVTSSLSSVPLTASVSVQSVLSSLISTSSSSTSPSSSPTLSPSNSNSNSQSPATSSSKTLTKALPPALVGATVAVGLIVWLVIKRSRANDGKFGGGGVYGGGEDKKKKRTSSFIGLSDSGHSVREEEEILGGLAMAGSGARSNSTRSNRSVASSAIGSLRRAFTKRQSWGWFNNRKGERISTGGRSDGGETGLSDGSGSGGHVGLGKRESWVGRIRDAVLEGVGLGGAVGGGVDVAQPSPTSVNGMSGGETMKEVSGGKGILVTPSAVVVENPFGDQNPFEDSATIMRHSEDVATLHRVPSPNYEDSSSQVGGHQRQMSQMGVRVLSTGPVPMPRKSGENKRDSEVSESSLGTFGAVGGRGDNGKGFDFSAFGSFGGDEDEKEVVGGGSGVGYLAPGNLNGLNGNGRVMSNYTTTSTASSAYGSGYEAEGSIGGMMLGNSGSRSTHDSAGTGLMQIDFSRLHNDRDSQDPYLGRSSPSPSQTSSVVGYNGMTGVGHQHTGSVSTDLSYPSGSGSGSGMGDVRFGSDEGEERSNGGGSGKGKWW